MKRIPFLPFLLSTVVLFSASLTVNAFPADLSPPKSVLGYADDAGGLVFHLELDELKLPENRGALPLRLDFSSARAVGKLNEFGWMGWQCGVLEAKAGFYGGDTIYQVNLLCGKSTFLRREAKESNRFQSPDGTWLGELDGDRFVLSRPDGWRLEFLKSRIAAMKTDTGAEVLWRRDAEGRLQEVAVKGAPQPLLSLEWTQTTPPRLAVLKAPTQAFRFAYDPVTSMLASLSVIQAPATGQAGSPTTPTFAFKQTLGGLAIDKLAHGDARAHATSWTFTWDATTGLITGDGSSLYEVTPQKPGDPCRMAITAKNGERTGCELFQDGSKQVWNFPDGWSRTIYRVTAPGPLHGALLRVDYKSPSGESFLGFAASYDHRGQILGRQWRGTPPIKHGLADGSVDAWMVPAGDGGYPLESRPDPAQALASIAYEYQPGGQHSRTLLDGKMVLERKSDAMGRTTEALVPGRYRWTCAYGQDGSKSEKTELLTPEPVTIERAQIQVAAVYGADGRKVSQNTLDGRTVSYSYDEKGRRAEELHLAPDGKTKLRRITISYSGDGTQRTETTEDLVLHKDSHKVFLLDADGRIQRTLSTTLLR